MDYADFILGGDDESSYWVYIIVVIFIVVLAIGLILLSMTMKEEFLPMEDTKKIMARAGEIQKDIDSCYYKLDCSNIDFCQKLDGVRTTCNENKYS